MKAVALVVGGLCAIAVAGGAWAAMARSPMQQTPTTTATWDAADPDLGRKAYTMCQSCHGLDGRGVPGYAPPLAGSRWLTGDPRAATLITLHGFDATSEPGAAYHSSRMLGHGGQLADHEIAGLLSWARQQWGNQAPAIVRDDVSALRSRFASHSTPWSPADLRAILKGP